MNCLEIRNRFSSRIDHELGRNEDVEVEQHLRVCLPCSIVYKDLLCIRESSRDLDPVSPPDRLWISLRAQIRAEGLTREHRGFWERLIHPGFVSGLRPALAATVVTLLLLAASSLLVTRLPHRQPETPVSSDALALQEVRDAELHYQRAIQALTESSQKRLETLDPTLAQIFNDNLATMDYYLKECKEAAETNPDNPLVHRYLLTAYQKKVELLQTIVNSDSL